MICTLTGSKLRAQGISPADSSTQKLHALWNHFETLLSPHDSNATTLPRVQGQIKELDLLVKALRTGHALGLDQVTAKSLKLPELREELLKVLGSVYVSGTVPEEWHLSALNPSSKDWGFVHANQLQKHSPDVHPCKIASATIEFF